MATIERRTGRDGQLVYRVKIRRKGHPPQTATFTKLSDALKWAQVTEGAVLTDTEWGWLEESPMCKVTKLKAPRGRVRFLSDEERQRLFEPCRASKNHSLYTIVVLPLATGACQQELLLLC